MKAAMLTPSERLRPGMGTSRIEYGANGKYVVRDSSVRMDPSVTPSERWFYDRFLPTCECAAIWVGIPVVGWWAIFSVIPWLYSFAFNHPIGR